MKNIISIFSLCFLMTTSNAQTISNWKIQDIVNYYSKNNDTTYIVNFWSTFCQPCIEEMPFLQSISKKYASKKVKLVFVSLDVKSFYPKKLKAFLKQHKITATSIWLNETNADIFCPAVEEKWSGAIPATIIVNNKKGYKQFYEEQFTPQQFEDALKKAINLN
ncbi:MAG: TlpA family protein disulfide reductase [Ferruginibacter sp.]|nr:TlpA family protein disulfide reductase [Ferruginibacter sp.]